MVSTGECAVNTTKLDAILFCSEVNSAGYSEIEEPIRLRKKHNFNLRGTCYYWIYGYCITTVPHGFDMIAAITEDIIFNDRSCNNETRLKRRGENVCGVRTVVFVFTHEKGAGA